MAKPRRSWLARFSGNRAANVATMTALVLPVGLILGAVAIDEGALYTERREAQALVDLAAITAAANIDKAPEAVIATLKDNGIASVVVRGIVPAGGTIDTLGTVIVTVARGRYSAEPALKIDKRFESGKTPFNAVKVTLEKDGTRYFASSLIAPPKIGTEAIAGFEAEAAFSVGSRLASLNGGLLNALIGGLVGGSISLKVMDYEALIAADVELLSFFDALATELHIRGGTYSDVLQSEATIGQVAKAMAAVPGLNATSRLALLAIAGGASSHVVVPLSHLVDLGSVGRLALGERPSGLTATANVMDMLTAAAAVANGENQVKLNLGATVPGLLAATVDLAIGEPPQHSPWLSIGETGEVVRTAQTRALITLEIGGPGGLLGTSIKLPVYVELAYAEAKLTEISCPTGRPDSVRVKVAARPGVAKLRIAEVNTTSLKDFRVQPPLAPAKIVKAPLVTILGQALVEVTNTSATNLVFNRQEITARTIKSVSTRNFTQSLATSLLANLHLEVNVVGLGLGIPSGLTSTLAGVLSTATPAIDTVLSTVLTTLGVRLGEADVRVYGAVCGRSVLVQ